MCEVEILMLFKEWCIDDYYCIVHVFGDRFILALLADSTEINLTIYYKKKKKNFVPLS